MAIANVSTAIIHKYGDSGDPCLTPLSTGKWMEANPWFVTQLHMFEYSVWTHFRIVLGKPNLLRHRWRNINNRRPFQSQQQLVWLEYFHIPYNFIPFCEMSFLNLGIPSRQRCEQVICLVSRILGFRPSNGLCCQAPTNSMVGRATANKIYGCLIHKGGTVTKPQDRPNFNGETIELGKWKNEFISHFTGHFITYHAGFKVKPC